MIDDIIFAFGFSLRIVISYCILIARGLQS